MAVFFGRNPYLDHFSRMAIFCWPVAVFGRMQPVFVQQIVDKKPQITVWSFFCGPSRMDRKKRHIWVSRLFATLAGRRLLKQRLLHEHPLFDGGTFTFSATNLCHAKLDLQRPWRESNSFLHHEWNNQGLPETSIQQGG